MQTINFDQTLSLQESKKPTPEKNEALVKMLYAGICNTDLEIIKGYMDFQGIPGHEFVGEVIECKSKPGLVWKRVVGEINISLLSDPLARRHDPARKVLGIHNKSGCFAEYFTIPADNLFPVPGAITSREATFVEPVAAALEIVEQVHIRPSDKIAVIGDGKLGILCSLVLKLQGADVTLIGKYEKKLALVEDKFISVVLNDDPELASVKFDLVVECSGSAEGLPFALNLVRPRGIIILKTTTSSPAAFNTNRLVIDEITLLGSRCGPFAPALKLLENKQIEVEPLIEAVYPLSDGLKAFHHAGKPGAMKILLHNS